MSKVCFRLFILPLLSLSFFLSFFRFPSLIRYLSSPPAPLSLSPHSSLAIEVEMTHRPRRTKQRGSKKKPKVLTYCIRHARAAPLPLLSVSIRLHLHLNPSLSVFRRCARSGSAGALGQLDSTRRCVVLYSAVLFGSCLSPFFSLSPGFYLGTR